MDEMIRFIIMCKLLFVARKLGKLPRISLTDEQSSSSSRISSVDMAIILDNLQTSGGNRQKTKENYRRIWTLFNDFLIRLDRISSAWEERASLFVANMINNGAQSATVKSYVSAIKFQLKAVKYEWNDGKMMLSTLTQACSLNNDRVLMRLPIHCSLLEMLLFEIERIYIEQPYLTILFQALFAIGYYGLFWIGELTQGDHCIKARNIHSAINKKKILIVLYTSKTHGKESHPQRVKISTLDNKDKGGLKKNKRFFCPFALMNNYLKIRGGYKNECEQLFVFRNAVEVVKPFHVWAVLKNCLSRLGIDSSLYSMHSLRIGRASDML